MEEHSSSEASENEEDKKDELGDLEEVNTEKEVLDDDAIQFAKERAENSNKISRALIVFGYDSWISLEPSKVIFDFHI